MSHRNAAIDVGQPPLRVKSSPQKASMVCLLGASQQWCSGGMEKTRRHGRRDRARYSNGSKENSLIHATSRCQSLETVGGLSLRDPRRDPAGVARKRPRLDFLTSAFNMREAYRAGARHRHSGQLPKNGDLPKSAFSQCRRRA
jgi:hypothetical protein